jgi:hypothetical protein
VVLIVVSQWSASVVIMPEKMALGFESERCILYRLDAYRQP